MPAKNTPMVATSEANSFPAAANVAMAFYAKNACRTPVYLLTSVTCNTNVMIWVKMSFIAIYLMAAGTPLMDATSELQQTDQEI